MKTFKTFMAAAMFASAMIIALPSAAQSDLTKKEKKEISKDIKASNKDLYKKPEKLVKKEAKKLTKEGWKTMDLPIQKQLERT